MNYYSPSTNGFYSLEVHPEDTLPEDAMEISAALRAELLEGQEKGRIIMPPDADHDGPWLADPPGPTEQQKAALVRAERDRRIAETDYLLMPDYSISPEDLGKVKAYRQALRDLPSQAGFPWDGGDSVPWPAPDW